MHRVFGRAKCGVLGLTLAAGIIGLPVAASEVFTQAQPQAPATAELRVVGAVSTPLTLSVADLQKITRTKISVMNPHDKKKEDYEGVRLADILAKAGVPHGEQLRGAAMATYVMAEASDGYKVVFSLAELDAGIQDSDVLVADTMNGAPLGPTVGPFRLVAPHEKRPARWVRMLKSITVVAPGAA